MTYKSNARHARYHSTTLQYFYTLH